MANSYFKMLNTKMKADYKNNFISDLQKDLRNSLHKEEDDLFSMLNARNNKSQGLDINLLLKYYMLNQIMGASQSKIDEVKYADTSNPEIKCDKNGNYYRVVNGDLIYDRTIKNVKADGGYIIEEKKNEHSLKVLKSFDKNGNILSLQVFDNNDNVVKNKHYAAELIGLRREYKKKYKYSGYSGNSRDMVASLKNFLSTPIETGYFMDFHCKFYKWQQDSATFVRMQDRDNDSPLLVDIEFCDNGTVLRQEYIGIAS